MRRDLQVALQAIEQKKEKYLKIIKMEELLNDFAKWLPNNMVDIFELIDNPEELVKKYIEQNKIG